MVICETCALKKEVHKACSFKRYVSTLGFGHTESTCLEKEVRKAYTFVLGPSQECFCGTDAEFIYSEILALIKPDQNNSLLFSSPVFICTLFKRYTYIFQPISLYINPPSQPPTPNCKLLCYFTPNVTHHKWFDSGLSDVLIPFRYNYFPLPRVIRRVDDQKIVKTSTEDFKAVINLLCVPVNPLYFP